MKGSSVFPVSELRRERPEAGRVTQKEEASASPFFFTVLQIHSRGADAHVEDVLLHSQIVVAHGGDLAQLRGVQISQRVVQILQRAGAQLVGDLLSAMVLSAAPIACFFLASVR